MFVKILSHPGRRVSKCPTDQLDWLQFFEEVSAVTQEAASVQMKDYHTLDGTVVHDYIQMFDSVTDKPVNCSCSSVLDYLID